MGSTQREKDQIRAYVQKHAHEEVAHLERAASELVGPVRHNIWDVHCPGSRWWVVTNPTNLYNQADFKSRDVVLTFHVGLALRMSYLQERDVPIAPQHAALLPGSWRRWQQAFDAHDSGDEAETFQAVGMAAARVPGVVHRRGNQRRTGARRREAAWPTPASPNQCSHW